MLDVEEDFAALAVVPDEDVHGVGVRNPSDETRVGRERGDGVALDVEVTLERLRIVREERVDETEELHDTLILSKILVTWKAATRVSASDRTEAGDSHTPLRTN